MNETKIQTGEKGKTRLKAAAVIHHRRNIQPSSAPPPARPPSLRRVGIVGGGFAGLSLARYLDIHATGNLEYCVFESKSDVPERLIGPFSLPNLHAILSELRLSSEIERVQFVNYDDTPERPTSNTNLVMRDMFLTLLREKVRNIEYDSRIVHMTFEQTNPSTIFLWSQSRKFGPFDMVVLATGIISPLARDGVDNVIFIGDKRWCRDRWWDFGSTRVGRGGQIALEDGLRVGKYLSMNQATSWRGKYCSVKIARRRAGLFRSILVAALCAVILYKKFVSERLFFMVDDSSSFHCDGNVQTI